MIKIDVSNEKLLRNMRMEKRTFLIKVIKRQLEFMGHIMRKQGLENFAPRSRGSKGKIASNLPNKLGLEGAVKG